MGKKVLIITGSPRQKGNTNALATAFASGAVAAGNEVEVFDAATANLHGCSGDKSCEQRGYCGQKDDGVQMNELMRQADVLVLVSPIYWSGFTSQIKRAIDRFYQFSFPKGRETLHIKELYLIAASANPDPAMFNDVVHAYEQLCELLHFDKGGTLLCPGLAGEDAQLIENTNYINACRTQARIKLDKPVDYFMRNPLGNHHIILDRKSVV